jgi:hypothetical protein
MNRNSCSTPNTISTVKAEFRLARGGSQHFPTRRKSKSGLQSSHVNRQVEQRNQHAIKNNAQHFNDLYFANLATKVIENIENTETTEEDNDKFNESMDKYKAMFADPNVTVSQLSDDDAEVVYNAIPAQARKFAPRPSSTNYKPYIFLLVIALLIEYVTGRGIRRGKCERYGRDKKGVRVCVKHKSGGGRKEGNKGGNARKSRRCH